MLQVQQDGSQCKFSLPGKQNLPVARKDPLRVSAPIRWVKPHVLFWQRAQFTLV